LEQQIKSSPVPKVSLSNSMFRGKNIMNNTEYLSSVISDILQQEKPCVLAFIVSHSGSTPRHNGSKMVVDSEGKIRGTIGGSLLEAAAIKQASSAISNCRSSLMKFDLDNESVDSKGMICGGKALILLDYIAPNRENREFFQKWSETIRINNNFFFLLSLKDIEGSSCNVTHGMLLRDGTIIGISSLQQDDINNLRGELHNIPATFQMQFKDSIVIVDPIKRTNKLYCIGAGHVALPTADLAASVGFDVIVIDDRAEFSNKERFPQALEVRVIKDYHEAYKTDEIDCDTFIVIVTRGHLFDRVALEQALTTKARYIGMMASKKKRDSIYTALKEQGFGDPDIARVHSPIGLEIQAETPEELAVSIVGELIKERAKTNN
jgi:xanthine dehydrogenase accessory factor